MEDRGIKVSRRKTEYLKFITIAEDEVETEVKLHGEVVKQVKEFK